LSRERCKEEWDSEWLANKTAILHCSCQESCEQTTEKCFSAPRLSNLLWWYTHCIVCIAHNLPPSSIIFWLDNLLTTNLHFRENYFTIFQTSLTSIEKDTSHFILNHIYS
jgi:hypothetical protein